MAMIDYGAIAFKNGKCIQREMIDDMFSQVGWVHPDLVDNHFSYIGDNELTFCFYKTVITICRYNYKINDYEIDTIYLSNSNYLGWKEYVDYTTLKDRFIDFTVYNLGDCSYDFRMKYKGNEYRCVFGYGIDLPYYMKTGRFNYYKSLRYKLYKLIHTIKHRLNF